MALGEQPFVADMTVPGMLHGALRFSDHPRAVVRRIDAARAPRRRPGSSRSSPPPTCRASGSSGLITPDWPVFVAEGETTRYVGDVLAAVAARTRREARAAAALIDVEYDVLEPRRRPVRRPGAGRPGHPRRRQPPRDLGRAARRRRGGAGVRRPRRPRALHDERGRARLPRAGGLPGGAGRRDPGEPALRLFSQGQGAWDDRRQVASLLALPETAVRVTQVATGGAFGGKEDLAVQGQTALLARVTGPPRPARPVARARASASTRSATP